MTMSVSKVAFWTLLSAFALASRVTGQRKIVLTNDDGWATANIRQQFTALQDAGYNTVLSAPAENQSGSGSLQAPPTPVLTGCEYDTCPALSPSTGQDASDARLNYVNSFPATCLVYGVQDFGPNFFEGTQPDFVVSGPNIGSNAGLAALISATVGAASTAVNQFGIPAIAVSGAGGSRVSYTTLSNTTADSTIAANVYSDLTIKLLATLLPASSTGNTSALLPANTILNVNYATSTASSCSSADDFAFILTRADVAIAGVTPADVNTCGGNRLPRASDVIGEGCFASVTVLDTTTKLDSSASAQAAVLATLGDMLTCAPSS